MARVKFIQVEVEESDPVYGPPCGALFDHTWHLGVEEGRMVLYSDCYECTDVVMGPAGGEDVEMAPIKGKLESHLERCGYYDPDYTHWWEFIPD